MTNNTIANVPRELLEDCLIAARGPINGNLAERLSALLSAPSPAGVDEDDEYMPDGIVQGIMQSEEVDAVALAAKSLKAAGVDGLNRYEVFPYLDDDVAELDICEADDGSFVKYDAAQAIIDGLRGEVAKINSDRLACWAEFKVMTRACLDAEKERDQQAQRIGELEGLLRHAQKQVPTGSGMHMRIDAALSAGKEGE